MDVHIHSSLHSHQHPALTEGFDNIVANVLSTEDTTLDNVPLLSCNLFLINTYITNSSDSAYVNVCVCIVHLQCIMELTVPSYGRILCTLCTYLWY